MYRLRTNLYGSLSLKVRRMKKTPARRSSGPTGKKFMLMPPAVWLGGSPFS